MYREMDDCFVQRSRPVNLPVRLELEDRVFSFYEGRDHLSIDTLSAIGQD
jgi:hypothetical protein